jgi:uncharacterized protein (TIGR03437 family)
LLTLLVEPSNPVSLPAAISAVFSSGSDQPMPVLQTILANTGCNAAAISAPCPQVLAVTVQVPYGIPVFCPVCATAALTSAAIVVSVNGAKTPAVEVQPLQDQVHFLTACDIIVAGTNSTTPFNGLPCTPLVTHADGRPVSAILPAQAGEELVAYATGLGETNPALIAGQPAPQSSPTTTNFGIDLNFRVNALATKPGAVGVPAAAPSFTGATKGYVGLYQINFVVPSPPAGLVPCVDNASSPTNPEAVQSNLTVSVGSNFSFDGAGICVLPGGIAVPLVDTDPR